MQKTLKAGSRITLRDQLQLMMQIELLNVVFMMNTISIKGKRTARAVLTGMCYSAGSAMRHGSSSLTRLTGQSAMTPSTWRR